MSSFRKKLMHIDAPSEGSFCARRDFLRSMLVAPAIARLLLEGAFELRLGIVFDDAHGDALLGARMSVQEANRAAALLGATLKTFELHLQDTASTTTLHAWISANRISALALACEARLLEALLSRWDSTRVAAVNCALPPDTVPALCSTGVFSVVPISSHLRQASIWDASLEKFGGAQLNARYQAAYHAPMSSAAWCGWFAVKLLWESATRAGAADAAALRKFLTSPRAAFDGHKGEMLRFDSTHVLRQPLYRVNMVNGRREVSEVKPAPENAAPCR